MLSSNDIECLILEKRQEIEKEKSSLGLAPLHLDSITETKCSKNAVKIDGKVSERKHDYLQDEEDRAPYDIDEPISADLERYIRRYTGLPIMLKAGEFSPNNPLIRGERSSGDALLGLGEYERRRNTLRKLRQQQYREYLDQQAKKKQEAKELADKQRKEREEREEAKERERRLLDQDRYSPERRPNLNYVNKYCSNKVDTGVQVGISRPLSVAVQTDDSHLYTMPVCSPSKSQMTQAERELSPRTVLEHDEKPIRRAWSDDYDDTTKKSVKDNQTLLPSIFDADAIELRNLQVEKEAAARRHFYQQELKNQIEEQQRIREERKCREKMLERAEMRRLEEQLRMLKMAQDKEIGKQMQINESIKENAMEFETKRKSLQNDIETEQIALKQPQVTKQTSPSKNGSPPSKLPFYYPKLTEKERKPYSMNIPDNSIFSPNYDVDSYLRKNLNPSKESMYYNIPKFKSDVEKSPDLPIPVLKVDKSFKSDVHKSPDLPIPMLRVDKSVKSDVHKSPDLPIPVLKVDKSVKSDSGKMKSDLSDAMKLVDDKWKVPVVQKNILKSVPNDEGKNVSILTQLGSIRRQLQLEQLRLDNMMTH